MRHLKLSFLLIAGVWTFLTHSMQVSPTLAQQESKPQEKRNIARDLSDAASSVHAEIQPKPPSENEPQEWIHELWRKESFLPPIWSNWALVLVAFGAACVALRTLNAIKRQADIATEGIEINRGATRAAQQTADAALESAKATIISQRAYLNASPAPPDQNSCVAVKIKNYGATPATITAIAISAGQQLPPNPKDPCQPNTNFSGHFLVKGEYFFHWLPWPRGLSGMQWYLFGYVDYITEFKEHRRFGFARTYIGGQFVFVSERGWSYDEERKQGEGNDWEE